MSRAISFKLNGVPRTTEIAPADSLNLLLREKLGMTGTKHGCDYGGCGSCTVIVDGKAVYSCMFPAARADGKSVRTIEGLATNAPHPIQTAFLKNCASQCGFSTPGMVMSALALLEENPDPSEEQIKQAISGNLCRCTGYVSIVKAISEAAKEMKARPQG